MVVPWIEADDPRTAPGCLDFGVPVRRSLLALCDLELLARAFLVRRWLGRLGAPWQLIFIWMDLLA